PYEGRGRRAGAGALSQRGGLMAQPVLEAVGVSKTFLGQRRTWAERRPLVQALRDVSLRLEPGQSVGLVGESGSGKSTLARLLLGLEQPSGGTLRLGGRDFDANDPRQRRALWQRVQMVFQDPKSSLNPHKTVRHALLAPLEALTSSSVTSR